MKKAYSFFTFIVLLVLGLMAVLVITQLNTSKSVNRLVNGNKQAAATFAINNRLEDIVNMSFELESKILSEKPLVLYLNHRGIQDSISKLNIKVRALDKIIDEAAISSSMDKILELANGQSTLSGAILVTENNTSLLDSLRKSHFSDSIYGNALDLQTKLESTLTSTLLENNNVADRVSWLNKLLAFTALIAVLLLATIILRRQVMQFILIRDLEQARKLALQSVKIKDQFLANMSHEIRTPLNALKGFSKILSKTRLDEEQQQYSNIINSSSESLLHIVNDILDLSKMEAGALAIKNKAFSLRELLKEIEETYSVSAAEKKLDFILEVPAGLEDNLAGDPERLKQVLVNLISNSIKFTNAGYVSLRLSPASTRNDITAINFAVADSGIGIPIDKQDLIFERFEQLDNSFVRQQGGTGLGLAITKMIVEAMGGHITVQSQPDQGSVFNFTLSFQLNKQPVVAEENLVQQLMPLVPHPSQCKILVAEDNKVNQLLVSKLLMPFNAQISIVGNGHEIFNLLENQSFDVILMDVQMPIMDGITATKLIRNKLGNSIPIIGMTAYVQPNEIEKCFAAGMNDYVPKPVNEAQFYEVLKKYIHLGDRQPGLDIQPATADFEFLEKLCNGNAANVSAILEELKKQLQEDLSAFEKSLFVNDPESLVKLVHHLKSTLSPLGPGSGAAETLLSFSRVLHNTGKWEDIEEAGKQLLDVLKETLELVKNKQASPL
ncbi:hypothetical protein BH11BAC4_BH11BAC4_16750 [soil metagenome]